MTDEEKRKACPHITFKVIYLENEQGSVQLEICKNEYCSFIKTTCEHKINDWNTEQTKLYCRLCGQDGT